MKGKVTALVGAQYGSEGKGVVAHKVAFDYKYHVRTGGPNAGHSFVQDGKLWKMQSLPCGWVNPDAVMIIGRGAVVDLAQLFKEVRAVFAEDPTIINRIIIDGGAGYLEPRHHEAEGGHTGEIGKRIGSTGEGVGACRVDRINRNSDDFRLIRDAADEVDVVIGGVHWSEWIQEDTPALLYQGVKNGENVLLEGTQGSALSLIHGPWPYVTSHDTNAASLASDAGVAPHLVTDVVLVARTYPIRVGGNSGPLNNEIDWDHISDRMGRKTTERTTVTKKLRRIGLWDEDLMRKAIVLNSPTSVALTFMDYFQPEDENCTHYDDLSDDSKQFIGYIEGTFGVPVNFIGTGFHTEKGWVCIER